MKYIETFNENIVYLAQTSWWIFLPAPLCAIVYLPLGVLVFLGCYLYLLTTELGITEKRVIAKWGFISRETVELRLDKVESVRVNQSILGRLLNYGDVIIIGSGATQSKIPFIKNPILFRQTLDRIIEEKVKK